MADRDYSFLEHAPRGVFFDKKKDDGTALPAYDEVKDKLPEPIDDERADELKCYRYASQVLFRNTHRPTAQSGFVSNFVDAAFNKDVFLWDTCFMTMFCNLFHAYIPGICSLDNFYCKQFDDGEIPRELVRETGKDFLLWVNAWDKPLYSYFHKHYGFRRLAALQNLPWEETYSPDLGRTPARHPYLTLDNLNHPILALAEWVSYEQIGDIDRLARVVSPLYHYYCAFHEHVRHVSGLYVTDWASMDNSPRNKYLGLAVDTSCEMVLFAHNLLDILHELEYHGRGFEGLAAWREFLLESSEQTTQAIRRYMWNEADGFFYDVDFGMKQTGIKTAAAFWSLISGVADEHQQKRLFDWLEDEKTFKRPHRVPVLAADEPGYHPEGGYWAGSVWAPMNQMIILGLEKCGNHRLAREIALNHLECLTKVFVDTGTIWENYPADFITSGDSDHRDMVGWSGLAPILYTVQYRIGLSADSRTGTVMWDLASLRDKLGCRRYAFFGKQADFMAVKNENGIEISVKTADAFTLALMNGAEKKTVRISGDTVLKW